MASRAQSRYPNYYTLLGIAPQADAQAIRASYRRAMREARKHPDLGGDHAEAALLGEAYSVLRDPQRRLAYDRVYLQQSLIESSSPPAAASAPTHERRGIQRVPYQGMLLFPDTTQCGLSGQCRDLSRDGCSFRTLRPLRSGERMAIIFQDDPGLLLIGTVQWQRKIPQRFGPPLYEGGVHFRELDATRFAQFLNHAGLMLSS